eukprot:scaffold2044_cov247-Pinguiococcus_pyrenoidosus.AAC.14
MGNCVLLRCITTRTKDRISFASPTFFAISEWIGSQLLSVGLRKACSIVGDQHSLFNLFVDYDQLGVYNEIDKSVRPLVKGLKRTIAQANQESGEVLHEGKLPLSFEAYAFMGRMFLEDSVASNAHCDGPFAHLYLTLSWCLMCRSSNTSKILQKLRRPYVPVDLPRTRRAKESSRIPRKEPNSSAEKEGKHNALRTRSGTWPVEQRPGRGAVLRQKRTDTEASTERRPAGEAELRQKRAAPAMPYAVAAETEASTERRPAGEAELRQKRAAPAVRYAVAADTEASTELRPGRSGAPAHLPEAPSGDKCILLLDVYSVHRDKSFRDAVVAEHFPDVILIYVPGNATELVQPLDCGFNGVLKSNLLRANNEFLNEELIQHRDTLGKETSLLQAMKSFRVARKLTDFKVPFLGWVAKALIATLADVQVLERTCWTELRFGKC